MRLIPNPHPYQDKKGTIRVKYKNQIIYTLQLIICVFIGLEISIKPNPYTTQLILLMTIYICLKHDLPNKVKEIIIKWWNRLK